MILRKNIGEICSVLNGYAFKSNNYVDSGSRVIRISNVQKGYVVDNDPKYYPLSEVQRLSKYVLHEGDLLVSLTGNVGRVGLINKDMLPAVLNQRVACLRMKDDAVILKYVFYFLNSDLFENQAIFAATGLAQKNLSTEWLKSVSLPVPSKEKQQFIVDELDLLTGIINKKSHQLDDFDKLSESLFYELFGDPIINENNWPVIPLGELMEFKNGINYRSGKTGNSILVVGVSDFQDRHELQPCDLSPETIEVDIEESYWLKDGDLVFVRSNGSRNLVGRTIIIHPGNEKVTFSGFCIRGRRKSDFIIPEFVSSLMRMASARAIITSSGQGCSISNLNQSILSSFPLIIPPVRAQEEYKKQLIQLQMQKQKIQRSIDDTMDLLNSRINALFG